MAIRSISYVLLIAGFAMAQAPAPPDAEAPPDEPGRQVARLSILDGDAQIKRGDTGEWVAAAVNTPLMAADSLAVGSNGRAEIQFDQSNFLRIAADTEVRLWALEDRRIQIQVAHGLVTWRVLRQGSPVAEINTPMAAVQPVGQPAVRVEVAPDGSTRVTPHHGEAEVSSPRGQEQVREGNTLVVEGQAETPTSRTVAAPPSDGWDQFNDQRDGFLTRAQSPRYASPDIYGTEDLDPYGRWVNDPNYGQVWSPNVPASWAPYRAGRWVWTDYYGWTWVDDAPWGWAPFHYGSWYFRVGYGWCWFPGPRQQHYFYHPAMVAFFGVGGGVGVGFGSVGWVPLAPFEPYRPWYGRGYGGRALVVNNVTVVNNTNIYNSFRNARAFNGVTAVSVNDFRAGNYRHPVAVSQGQLTSASLVRGTPFTPTQSNLRFSDRAVSPLRVNPGAANQRFYSRSAGAPQGVAGFRGGAPQSAPARNAAPAQNDAWQRFGSPAAANPGAPARVQEQPRAAPGFGGQRFSTQPRTVAPPAPLQVAPPVVRQRQVPPPQNGGGGFGAPTRQPQMRPAPPNPGVQRGGGGPGGGGRPAGPPPRNGGAPKGNERDRGGKH